MLRLVRCSFWAASLLAAPAPGAVGNQPYLTLNGNSLSLSAKEEARLQDLNALVSSNNRISQDRALVAAREGVRSTDARHILALYQIQIGRQREDDALRAEALDILISSPLSPSKSISNYLDERGDIAYRHRDFATASAVWSRAAEMKPNAFRYYNLAQVREAQGDSEDAAQLIRQAVEASWSKGETPPEGWYRQWIAIAHNSGLTEEGAAAGQAFVGAYPEQANWRYVLLAYRQMSNLEGALEIDLFRLMRAAGILMQSAEYQRFAQLLLHAGFAEEARDVLEEGLRTDIVSLEHPVPEILNEINRALSRRVGEYPAGSNVASLSGEAMMTQAGIFFEQGHYSEAVTLYRSALGREGVDPQIANFRIALSLAMGGYRADAETAFRIMAESSGRAFESNAYNHLARFWLLWLQQSSLIG